MTNLLGIVKAEELPDYIKANVTEEIISTYPNVKKGNSFDQTLIN